MIKKIILSRESFFKINRNFLTRNLSELKQNLNEPILEKNDLFSKLSTYNIKQSNFSSKTHQRIKQMNEDFVLNSVKNLHDYGLPWQRIVDALENHEDWSKFSRDIIAERMDVLRNLRIPSETHYYIIARNPAFMNLDHKTLHYMIEQLKVFFSQKQLSKLLTKNSNLLTGNLEVFKYKFYYVFFLMGIKQPEMVSTFLFHHPIKHIRERHLFLARSGLYDKPNKKNETKIKNPFLIDIIDTKLDTYLEKCCKNLFDKDDFEAFCSYLKEENFDNELLGYNIGKGMENSLLKDIQTGKQGDSLD